MSKEKEYTFFSTEKGRFTLKESELEESHKQHLMGELMKAWNDNPKENQHRFMEMLYRESQRKQSDLMSIKLEALKREPIQLIDFDKLTDHDNQN